MQAIVKFFGQLLYKLCYFIGKYVCKAIGALCKFAWKMGKNFYQNYKEKIAGETTMKEHEYVQEGETGPDESVRITPKEKFANLTDEDLRMLLDKMTGIAVEVDKHPELEKVYETYGSDSEVFKQEIMDELKRREMSKK